MIRLQPRSTLVPNTTIFRSMNTYSKKLIAVVLGMLVLGAMSVKEAKAANPATINIRATVAPALSAAEGSGTYSFGTLPAYASSISTSPIVVTNDSLGRTEDY